MCISCSCSWLFYKECQHKKSIFHLICIGKVKENANTLYSILRHLRRRTSHWRPLQFFFFTPSLFTINIHFIHISDLSHVYHQERLKYYITIDTVNGKNDSCIKDDRISWLYLILINNLQYWYILLNIISQWPQEFIN